MKNRKREIRTSGSVRDEDGQHPHLLGRFQGRHKLPHRRPWRALLTNSHDGMSGRSRSWQGPGASGLIAATRRGNVSTTNTREVVSTSQRPSGAVMVVRANGVPIRPLS